MQETRFFRDYVWIDGRPHGKGQGETYKITSDPYGKHTAIERYENGKYVATIYDSRLLNFKHLKRPDTQAWQRETLIPGKSHILRDQNNTVLFQEEIDPDGSCHLYSPQGTLLSIHRIASGRVTLYDANLHPVMVKRYALTQAGEFGELLEESWQEGSGTISPQKTQSK